MGRMLGAFDGSDELDRPDLNKCPDCLCFFAGDNCPLCGKVCPEEMRAGNRKPPKKEKKRRQNSGRLTFVEWYHSWWFIILMMFLMPIVGIILLATSPHKKSSKITFIIIACVYLLITTIGIGTIIGWVLNVFDPPVNTKLSREEYVAKCESVEAENVWHDPEAYKDKFLKITVTVSDITEDAEGYYSDEDYTKYYICKIEGLGKEILVRSCIQSGPSNFAIGDKVTFYGEGDGTVTIYDFNYNDFTAPCVNAAYAELQKDK